MGIPAPAQWNSLDRPAFTAPAARTAPQMDFITSMFGAVMDGVTDDTAAIQAAINAAEAAGAGRVLHLGASAISTTLIITSDNIHLEGVGRGSQLIALAGFPAAPMVQVQNTSGNSSRNGIRIADMLFQNTYNNTASGIELQSTYYATIERVDLEGVYAVNIYLNGKQGTNSIKGAYTTVNNCHLGAVPGGPGSSGIGIKTNQHEFNTITRSWLNWFNGNGASAIYVQDSDVRITECTFDECYDGVFLQFCNAAYVAGNSFARGINSFVHNYGAKQCKIVGNQFEDWVGNVGANPQAARIVVENTGKENLYEGNTFRSGDTWPYDIYEHNGPTAPSQYLGNKMNSTAAVVRATSNNAGGVFRNNPGYNPVGHAVTQPAIPASGTAQTNTTGVDCTVFVAGGTVSAVAIGGTSTGATSGAFRVPAGQTITLTYSVAPTWQWFGD